MDMVEKQVISELLLLIFSLDQSIATQSQPAFYLFLYVCVFFALITEDDFLISPCYPLELCIQTDFSFILPFAFRFPSSLMYFLRHPQTTILPFSFTLLGLTVYTVALMSPSGSRSKNASGHGKFTNTDLPTPPPEHAHPPKTEANKSGFPKPTLGHRAAADGRP